MMSPKLPLFSRLWFGFPGVVARLSAKGWQFCERLRLLTHSLRSWIGARISGPRGRKRAKLTQPSFRPNLLALEERALPGETVGGLIAASAIMPDRSDVMAEQVQSSQSILVQPQAQDRGSQQDGASAAAFLQWLAQQGPSGGTTVSAQADLSSGGHSDDTANSTTTRAG